MTMTTERLEELREWLASLAEEWHTIPTVEKGAFGMVIDAADAVSELIARRRVEEAKAAFVREAEQRKGNCASNYNWPPARRLR